MVDNSVFGSKTTEEILVFGFASGYLYLFGIFVVDFFLKQLFSSQIPSFGFVYLFSGHENNLHYTVLEIN